jgi:hypothetical protein
LSQKELRAINRKSGDNIAAASQVPKELRAEGRFVKVNRRISVADRQHGRDLSHQRITASIRRGLGKQVSTNSATRDVNLQNRPELANDLSQPFF